MAPYDGSASLEELIQIITTTTNYQSLQHKIRNGLPKEARDTVLASPLPGGQDPLSVLDLRVNTLGVLYIMSARLSIPSAPPPPLQQIQEFCHVFIPEQARYAPDRVTLLARGIVRLSEQLNNPRWAIQPLYDLVTRYPPDPSYLTPVHPIFTLACAQNLVYTAALPLLQAHPITSVDVVLCPDLTYTDNLLYHYLGGMILSCLKEWELAEEYFEICVTSPAQVPAALQFEALKKLVLVQLIWRGKTSPLPKYSHPQLSRLLKNSVYTSFINAYPRNIDHLRSIVDKQKGFFESEKTSGLIHQALTRAPRWAIKRLTETYLTLHLNDIAKAVKIQNEDEVRVLITDMIELSDISAQISSTGTVTFSDAPTISSLVGKADVEKMLKNAQEQSDVLSRLESELARNRDYLNKALKAKDDPWAGPSEEDMYGMGIPGMGSGNMAWAEEMFG